MFTMPYSAFRMMIAAPKDSPIGKIDDLSGKKVGVHRGTPPGTGAQQVAVPDMEIVRFEDDSTIAQALIVGQIDAFAMPDTGGDFDQATRPDADSRSSSLLRPAQLPWRSRRTRSSCGSG